MTYVTLTGLKYIAEESPGLRHLDVSWCRKVTDVSMHQLIDGCSMLTKLDVSNCDAISDGVVHRLENENDKVDVTRNFSAGLRKQIRMLEK